MFQVTPPFSTESPVTVGVKVWVAPPISVALPGLMVTTIGVRVTVEVADLVGSLTLVAVIVAEAAPTGVAAV